MLNKMFLIMCDTFTRGLHEYIKEMWNNSGKILSRFALEMVGRLQREFLGSPRKTWVEDGRSWTHQSWSVLIGNRELVKPCCLRM